MTVSLKILLASFTLASAGAAYADCAAELARFESETTSSTAEGIAKDGSLAPLQDASGAGQTANTGTVADSPSDENRIAKDGSTAPLEEAGDAVPDQATSAQDAQAQQEGEPTAAAQASGQTGGSDRAAALNEARRALEAGDEAACMAALERITAS